MLSLHSLPPFSAPIHRLTRPQIQSHTNKPNSLTLTHTRTHFLTRPPHRGPTATPFFLLLPRAIPSPDPNDNDAPSKSTDVPDDCSSSDDNNCSSSNDDKSTDEGDDKSTDEGDDKSTDEGDDKSTDEGDDKSTDDKQPVQAKSTSSSTLQLAVVIVASLLVFRNPIRPLNALGSAIAVFGTFLYSQAMMMGKNKKI